MGTITLEIGLTGLVVGIDVIGFTGLGVHSNISGSGPKSLFPRISSEISKASNLEVKGAI